MKISDYLKKRELERLASLEVQKSHRKLCLSCMRATKNCFCKEITPFQTKTAFRILMHPMEAKKEKVGTGRLANYALDNSQIIVDENFDKNQEVAKILNSTEYYPLMLYPGNNSLNLSKKKMPESYYNTRTPLIFILDATWSCAKSMMRDSICLHDLPRISFDSNIESKFDIKQQPAKYCLSTIESIYQVLVELENQGIEEKLSQKEQLPQILQRLVDFQIKCAQDPSLKHYSRRKKSYGRPEDRNPSKKWLQRKICFEG